MLATFMEVLDTSIAAVALPYIAGSLSATIGQGFFVVAADLSCAGGMRLAFPESAQKGNIRDAQVGVEVSFPFVKAWLRFRGRSIQILEHDCGKNVMVSGCKNPEGDTDDEPQEFS